MGFWLLKYILSYGIRLNFCFTLPTGTLFTKRKPEVRLSDYLKMANRLWLWALVVCQFFTPRSPFTSKDRSLVSQLGFWYRSDSSWRLMSLRQRDYWLLRSSLRASSPIWASEASLRRSLASSRETRFARPNRRACSQATCAAGDDHLLLKTVNKI